MNRKACSEREEETAAMYELIKKPKIDKHMQMLGKWNWIKLKLKSSEYKGDGRLPKTFT